MYSIFRTILQQRTQLSPRKRTKIQPAASMFLLVFSALTLGDALKEGVVLVQETEKKIVLKAVSTYTLENTKEEQFGSITTKSEENI